MGNGAHAQPFRLGYTMGSHADGKHGTLKNTLTSSQRASVIRGLPALGRPRDELARDQVKESSIRSFFLSHTGFCCLYVE
jgi:hypothetical protein